MPPMATTLIVNEIYRTLSGEGTSAGRPCVIVRLTGCGLRCSWCDSTYAYDEGREMALADVLAEVARLEAPLVLVTGGEPLDQPAAPALLSALCDAGRDVLLETHGGRDIAALDRRIRRSLDVKCPGSGEAESFLPANLDVVDERDDVKFVLADRTDYDYAVRIVREHRLAGRTSVIFTPVAAHLAPAELAAWMLADADLPAGVRLGLQLHKIIWPDADRGV